MQLKENICQQKVSCECLMVPIMLHLVMCSYCNIMLCTIEDGISVPINRQVSVGKKAQPNCVSLMLHVPGSHCFLRVAGAGLGLGDVVAGLENLSSPCCGRPGDTHWLQEGTERDYILLSSRMIFWPATVNLRSCCSQSFEL